MYYHGKSTIVSYVLTMDKRSLVSTTVSGQTVICRSTAGVPKIFTLSFSPSRCIKSLMQVLHMFMPAPITADVKLSRRTNQDRTGSSNLEQIQFGASSFKKEIF